MPDQRPWPGPPAGVSTTDGQGRHQSISVEQPKRTKGRGRRPEVGEDPIADLNNYRKVSGSENPVGTGNISRDVRVGQMPKTKRPRRHMASFNSVDGNVYTFRTHQPNGKPIERRNELALFIAMREVSLGGTAFPIFEAFNLKIADADGKQFFPVPHHLLNATEEAYVEEEEDNQFSLGEEGD